MNAQDLVEHLEKNSKGLHVLDIVALRTNMLLLYKNAASMPDFILTMEEAQKKAKRAKLPILDIELSMYVATSVLQSGAHTKEINEWEGHNANKKTWTEWKQAYLATYAQGINHQHAGATYEPFTRAANNIMHSWALSTTWHLQQQATRPPSNPLARLPLPQTLWMTRNLVLGSIDLRDLNDGPVHGKIGCTA